MFGTIILDAYRKDEITQIAEALDDLCSPNDNYGWSSAGIYNFWDYENKELLYIGLASDLANRFRQHNGLIPLKSGSKQNQITEYFLQHPEGKLGYSILVQIDQPTVMRNRNTESDPESMAGIEEIKEIEGMLIEAYRRKKGCIPPWNEVGGSVYGQKNVSEHDADVVDALCHPEMVDRFPLMSRSCLRELSANPMYVAFEEVLHAARHMMMTNGMSFRDSLTTLTMCSPQQIIDIERTNYLQKKLQV